MSSKHILIIGGTGMLKECTSRLLLDGNYLSIIGRDMEKLNQFINKHPDYAHNLNLTSVDYSNFDHLKLTIDTALKKMGA